MATFIASGGRVWRKFVKTFPLGSNLSLKRSPTSALANGRLSSTSSENVLVSKDEKSGIATVRMNNPPVNSLNTALLLSLRSCFEELEKDKSCRALILTSNKPKVFCAGLDILELYQKSPDYVGQFWEKVQDMWLSLYGSRLVTMAAINGHSPAGGCLLSLACDYRIMAEGNFVIGLNETQLDLVAPFWLRQMMVDAIGYRQAEMALMVGALYPSNKALQLGLVDKLVPIEDVQTVAEEEVKNWLKIPDQARAITKMASRKPLLDELRKRKQEDIQTFRDETTRESVQLSIQQYLDKLKAKK
ncbi:enoyl-CoA delta isomerase 1, mitochondrial-like [Branchiostoma floridae]|uniref:Enoyl-CoA delta isomerase 1, mitochondrial n=1 Tax=Branchiostoma floridae TaxID=7739 RepID=A0A9J7M536_BRAFL|nr:enoyl-CoA delta isomerase 1, mitochondrial-like [Branchiostoma floridae]